MNANTAKTFSLRLVQHIRENEVTARGAQLSYFLILSIFPFLIFLLAMLDYTPLTQQDTLQQLALFLPQTAFTVVEQILTEISSANQATLLSFGFLGTIWAASRGTFAIIKSSNKAYNTIESRSFLHLNFIGIISVFALALIILFSLALLIFGRVLGQLVFESLGLEEFFYLLWAILRYLIPVLFIFVVFCFMYLFFPNVSLRLRSIYPGAVFSTVGWITVSQVFAYYVNNFGNYSRTYGSIGGIIVFLVWLYISSVVILLGGEINAILHQFLINKANPKIKSKLPLQEKIEGGSGYG